MKVKKVESTVEGLVALQHAHMGKVYGSITDSEEAIKHLEEQFSEEEPVVKEDTQ